MILKIQTGTYIYTMDGEEVVREPWHILTRNDGSRTVTSSRISEAFGIQIDLRASESQEVSRYSFTFMDLKTNVQKAQGYYEVEHEKIKFRNLERDDWETISCGKSFFPLMRIFTGDLVRKVVEAGGGADIIVPDIRNPSDTSTLFKPLESRREITADPVQDYVYHYLGGHYKSAVPVTLDDDGVMSHYAWTAPDGSKWACNNCIQS